MVVLVKQATGVSCGMTAVLISSQGGHMVL
jgi:hypothetical protein